MNFIFWRFTMHCWTGSWSSPASGNGVITFDEFAILMESQDQRLKYDKQQLWEQFKMFDRASLWALVC